MEFHTQLPDKLLWKDETKIKYQESFQTADIKTKLKEINKVLEEGCINAQHIIDMITDVIVSAGNRSLVRKSFKSTKNSIRKVNKKWYDMDCKTLL